MSPTSRPTGPAAAALFGMGVGLLSLAASHMLSEVSEPFKRAMQDLGNRWIPGAEGIGPYSGKETTALLVWLLSWALLHLTLRRRDANVVVAGVVAYLLAGTATTLLWPPITHVVVERLR